MDVALGLAADLEVVDPAGDVAAGERVDGDRAQARVMCLAAMRWYFERVPGSTPVSPSMCSSTIAATVGA
ncbi:hypothetical protein MRU69_13115 [Kocuria flava]|uniref:hypothetical protein n=1 Tax=Kocuria flava TaxID=446860 RepID=UPI001FF29B4C|nr:hypothetical protein [Kocuria flava]MCJ8505780.1 hypothetical protein [Kocuria flava]